MGSWDGHGRILGMAYGEMLEKKQWKDLKLKKMKMGNEKKWKDLDFMFKIWFWEWHEKKQDLKWVEAGERWEWELPEMSAVWGNNVRGI